MVADSLDGHHSCVHLELVADMTTSDFMATL